MRDVEVVLNNRNQITGILLRNRFLNLWLLPRLYTC